ncbi:Glycoside hydrolase family 16 [Dillenia turbinata]|uniref:xyloglucan:xyloglucosyl transferase n=1 Tax=Dillenia turbinata TaxID=194707 RepID=A0AAN8VM68_9MAGN
MKIKLPDTDTSGVVTTFYLITGSNEIHKELDFEFLGNRERHPIVLQTNVYANGVEGGKRKINWSSAHFMAYYQGFSVDGCNSTATDCQSPNYWWNAPKYWQLDGNQQQAYENTRKYVVYDYCTDRKRHPTPPPECIPP